LLLDTSRNQHAARRPYERNGFEPHGEVEIGGIPSLLFRLRRR
jgi:hypothetical protein